MDMLPPAPGGSRARKLILDKVRMLGHTEHQEIFALLKTHSIAYSSNSNGVFINLSTVPDSVLSVIKAFVDYCALNKTGLDEYEKKLQECKITHKFDSITNAAVSIPPAISPAVTNVTASRSPHTSSAINSLPSVLVNGRFQATKKRLSRRKIIDKRQVVASIEGERLSETGVLMPEPYSYSL